MGVGNLAKGDTPRMQGKFDKGLFTRTVAVARMSNSRGLQSEAVSSYLAPDRGCLKPSLLPLPWPSRALGAERDKKMNTILFWNKH